MMHAIVSHPAFPIAVGLLLGVAGMAIAFVVLRNRRRRFLAIHGPTFMRLCEGLGVGRFDQWRLRRLADRAGLITPAVLLISQGAFDDALRRAAVRSDAGWPSAFRSRVFAVENRPAS